jgi:hypothetical protein
MPRALPSLAAALAIALAAAACGGRAGEPPAKDGKGAIVENATPEPVQLAVFYAGGTHWQGSLEGNSTARYDGDFRTLERLELTRPDGSLHRYDRKRLDLLAKHIAASEAVVLRIEAEGVRAVTVTESERLAKERP